MNELLAQGPEFAGDNVTFSKKIEKVDLTADAVCQFWGARAVGDLAAMQTARQIITEMGGTNPSVMRRANELRNKGH